MLNNLQYIYLDLISKKSFIFNKGKREIFKYGVCFNGKFGKYDSFNSLNGKIRYYEF
jgi:hypothetical protein